MKNKRIQAMNTFLSQAKELQSDIQSSIGAKANAGAIITLLLVCGLSHRQSYKDIFVVAVAIPLAALVVVITLGTAFGGF